MHRETGMPYAGLYRDSMKLHFSLFSLVVKELDQVIPSGSSLGVDCRTRIGMRAPGARNSRKNCVPNWEGKASYRSERRSTLLKGLVVTILNEIG